MAGFLGCVLSVGTARQDGGCVKSEAIRGQGNRLNEGGASGAAESSIRRSLMNGDSPMATPAPRLPAGSLRRFGIPTSACQGIVSITGNHVPGAVRDDRGGGRLRGDRATTGGRAAIPCISSPSPCISSPRAIAFAPGLTWRTRRTIRSACVFAGSKYPAVPFAAR